MIINELFPTVIGFSENKKHNNLLTRHLYKIQNLQPVKNYLHFP